MWHNNFVMSPPRLCRTRPPHNLDREHRPRHHDNRATQRWRWVRWTMYGGYGWGYGWGLRLVRLEPLVRFLYIFYLYPTNFSLQADYVTGTETTMPPPDYDRARDASADASPFIGMLFFYIPFLMNFIIYHNCSYYNDFNDHNHHVTPPIPHQRTATATITKTLPPSSHIDVCVAIQQVDGSPHQH